MKKYHTMEPFTPATNCHNIPVPGLLVVWLDAHKSRYVIKTCSMLRHKNREKWEAGNRHKLNPWLWAWTTSELIPLALYTYCTDCTQLMLQPHTQLALITYVPVRDSECCLLKFHQFYSHDQQYATWYSISVHTATTNRKPSLYWGSFSQKEEISLGIHCYKWGFNSVNG